MRLHTMLIGGLVGVCLLAGPARAQERTIEQYDVEVGAAYVFLAEEGDRKGHGFLVEGGYEICTLGAWHCQVVAELMVARFGKLDATFKQVAGGVRLGQLLTPKVRAFAQFRVGVQNDGFSPDSNTGTVFMPGGGVSYALTEALDLQVMLDVPFARYDGETFNQFRLAAGIGIPLGGR